MDAAERLVEQGNERGKNFIEFTQNQINLPIIVQEVIESVFDSQEYTVVLCGTATQSCNLTYLNSAPTRHELVMHAMQDIRMMQFLLKDACGESDAAYSELTAKQEEMQEINARYKDSVKAAQERDHLTDMVNQIAQDIKALEEKVESLDTKCGNLGSQLRDAIHYLRSLSEGGGYNG